MPLVREPSLRAPRTWTKWSNGSKSTAGTSKNNAPSEIIHLGGSRVGTPEPADPVDRPVTQWFSLPPPPQPPVELPAPTSMSRIASVQDQMLSPASTTSSLLSPAPLNLAQRDRVPAPLESTPSSSAYPSPMLTGESANSSRSRDSTRLTGSSTSSRQPSTDADSPIRTSHPLSIDMFSSSAASYHPRSVDMLSPSAMSQTQSVEMVSPSVASHPRSVDMFSPSTSSHFRNFDKVPPATATAPAIPEGHSLRRTQSAANIQERSRSERRARTKWKALPAHPSNSDGEMDAPASHVAQLVHPEAGVKKVFPPPANPPPKGPLPSINPTPVNDGSRQRRGSAPEQVPEPKPKSLLSGRYTPQERLWLHRNYRGEVNFLKSWGLRIESDADRCEGADLLRELMQSETEMKASKQHRKKEQKMETHELHINPEEPEGLHIILEEERSPQNATFEVRGAQQASHDGTGVNLRVPVWARPGSSGSEARMSPTRAEHKKSESEHSVLGAYLDVRMSRLD